MPIMIPSLCKLAAVAIFGARLKSDLVKHGISRSAALAAACAVAALIVWFFG